MIFKFFLLILVILSIGCTPISEKHIFNKYLTGRWKVSFASVLPFDMTSCKDSLNINSILEFTSDNIFKVFQTDKSPQKCNLFERYVIQDSSQLNIVEGDAVLIYQFVKITADSLIIRSNYLPKFLVNQIGSLQTPSDSIKIKNINKEGILIKMIKI